MKFTLSQRCGAVTCLSESTCRWQGAVPVRAPMATRPCVRSSRVVVGVAQDLPDGQYWDSQESDAQLFDRVVEKLQAKDFKDYVESGWTVLDVRPPAEVSKVHLSGAQEVPLWVPDTNIDPLSLLKRLSAFGMCGWWFGAEHMMPNESFLEEVQAKIPLDAKVVVACQSGIRSRDAAEQLAKTGYQTLAWVDGGLNKSKPGQVPTEEGEDVRMAGIGGLSSALRWTRLQQENAGALGGWRTPLAIIGALWLLNIITLSLELRPLMDHLKETGF